jgi:hypothetical protein
VPLTSQVQISEEAEPPSKQLLTHTQAAIGEQQFEQQRGCTPSECGTSV